MATQAKKIVTSSRMRTKLRIRKKIRGSDDIPRLSVFRSSKHMYAQLISDDGHKTLVSASTNEKELVSALAEYCKEAGVAKASTKSSHAAKVVGQLLAKRAVSANLEKAVFDRNGFVYTGRIKALADGAREGGLKF